LEINVIPLTVFKGNSLEFGLSLLSKFADYYYWVCKSQINFVVVVVVVVVVVGTTLILLNKDNRNED
jgi:hypothetical protein